MKNNLRSPDFWLSALLIALLLSTIYQICALASRWEWYSYIFGYLPEPAIRARYVISLLQRVVVVGAVMGILNRKEFWRKVLIVLGLITILIGGLKHPLPALINHLEFMEKFGASLFGPALASIGVGRVFATEYAIYYVILLSLIDIFFWGALIYLLTRPQIKIRFK